MSKEFAIADVMPGKLNALVKNIMQQTGTGDPNEAVRLVNSGEWILSKPTRSWHEENDIVYLPPFTTDGTTGEGWIYRLKSNGFHVGDDAQQMLLSPFFRPSKPGTVIESVILKSKLFHDDDHRTMTNIYGYARRAFLGPNRRKLMLPNAELACLIRLNFTGEEIEAMGMGYIITVHEPIPNSHNTPYFLGVDSSGVDGGNRLNHSCASPGLPWGGSGGFAFELS